MYTSKGFSSIIVVLILLFIGGVLIFLYRTVNSVPNITNPVSDTIPFEPTYSESNKLEKELPLEKEEVAPLSNERTYTSKNLGISFSYLVNQGTETIEVKEVDNKIYIFPSSLGYSEGQYVEVFEKRRSETLPEALKRILLEGYSEEACEAYLSEFTGIYPENFEIANIRLTGNPDMEELMLRYDNCPFGYTQSNGISYFLMDTNHPEKFLFFSIGQYAISASEGMVWQDTVRFVD